MPQPGQFQPRGEDWIPRKLTDIERQIRELAAANPFGPMGIKPQSGGMVVEGYQTVNGPMTITGSLDLPAGSVSDSALANPVQTATASNGITNYAIGTTATVRASVTLTVPTGFTRAIITATATAMGANSGATADYLYGAAVVAGVNGGELYSSAAPGLGASLAAPFNPTLTGLTDGQVITVGVATRTGAAAWAASTANQASISATVMYLR